MAYSLTTSQMYSTLSPFSSCLPRLKPLDYWGPPFLLSLSHHPCQSVVVLKIPPSIHLYHSTYCFVYPKWHRTPWHDPTSLSLCMLSGGHYIHPSYQDIFTGMRTTERIHHTVMLCFSPWQAFVVTHILRRLCWKCQCLHIVAGTLVGCCDGQCFKAYSIANYGVFRALLATCVNQITRNDFGLTTSFTNNVSSTPYTYS